MSHEVTFQVLNVCWAVRHSFKVKVMRGRWRAQGVEGCDMVLEGRRRRRMRWAQLTKS